MKNERKEPIQIPHIQTINDYISYLTPTEHPLSANVVIIEGDAFFWVYDVGNHPAVSEILQKKSEQTGKEIRVILSHFHPDHIGNLSEISCEAVYQGKNTFRYTKTGTVIEEDTWFQDGDVRLHLFPIPSSHAKGSLALEVDETWCFLGDAAYATQKNGQCRAPAGRNPSSEKRACAVFSPEPQRTVSAEQRGCAGMDGSDL